MDTRDVFSTAVNGHGGVRGSSPINDYEQLDEISTIGKSRPLATFSPSFVTVGFKLGFCHDCTECPNS